MRTTIKFLSKRDDPMADLGTPVVTGKSSVWRTPVASAMLAMVLSLTAMDVQALALGRITVQSALGEPLRAEIDVPDINADEAASLKTTVANPDAFKAAGLEFNPALGSLQISLQRRPDGRSYLRLTGDRPVNEPFVDLILEANWASGRIVRDYTMLFDPANLRANTAQATTVTPAATPRPSAPPAVIAAPRLEAPRVIAAAPSYPAVRASRPQPAPRPLPAPKRKIEKPVALSEDGKAVTVKKGSYASEIALRNKPKGISLDQMLVSMLRANPDAFVDNNINRLKSGAVLEMPSASQAGAVGAAEARQVLTAQSKDFNEFRRRLASGAPTTSAPSASRAAGGTVQANVQERKPSATTADKLTLSKGTVAAAAAASAASADKEEAIAKDRQAKDTAARSAELAKNIQELDKLVTSTTATLKPAVASATASAAKTTTPSINIATGALTASAAKSTASVVSTAKPALAVASVSAADSATKPAIPTPVVTASASTVTSMTATTASVAAPTIAAAPAASSPAPNAQVEKPATPAVKAPVTPTPEPGLVDGLLDNPVTLPAAGGLLALLAGFGFYRLRSRKKSDQADSSFLESRLQPDSFFGASGGQRIDTNESTSNAAGSSMVYSPSQLDAAGDVDPVAEADVYLAYGRDLQAEEILKEALRTNPSRVAIHTKLMEIYAKRRDTKAFETVANEAYSISKGQGSEWEAASAIGRELDPANPLYQPGGTPKPRSGGTEAGLATAGAAAFGSSTIPQPVHPEMAQDRDVDFDLDIGFDEEPSPQATPVAIQSYSAAAPIQPPITPKWAAASDPMVDLSFDVPSAPASAAMQTVKASPGISAVNNAMDFDMGDLSLDLPAIPATANSTAGADLDDDPLSTKLALAEEFREIGDVDGARLLAEEVAMEATGAL